MPYDLLVDGETAPAGDQETETMTNATHATETFRPTAYSAIDTSTPSGRYFATTTFSAESLEDLKTWHAAKAERIAALGGRLWRYPSGAMYRELDKATSGTYHDLVYQVRYAYHGIDQDAAAALQSQGMSGLSKYADRAAAIGSMVRAAKLPDRTPTPTASTVMAP